MKLLLVTPGDPDGIGPEITWKTLRAIRLPRGYRVICVGATAPLRKLGVHVVEIGEGALERPERLPSSRFLFLPAPTRAPKGRLLPGYQAGWSIEKAAKLILAGKAHALVTGPINKERLQRGGY